MTGQRLRTWLIPALATLLVGGLLGWVVERPAASVETRTSLGIAGVVVSLSRPGGVEGAVMAGFPTPLDVEVISAAPVTEIELRAGATVIDRVILDEPLSAFTATLRWAPDEGLHVLTAQVFTTDGRSGYSNPLNLFATDIADGLYALVEATAEDGDTLDSIATAFQVEVGHLEATNEGMARDQPIPAGTTVQVPIVFADLPAGTATGSPFPSEVQALLDEAGPEPTETPPLPDSVVASDQPSMDVEVSVAGCVATVEFDTDGLEGDVGLVRIHQPSPNRIPVDLEMDGSMAKASHPLGAGVYDYLVELTTGGSRRLVGSARAFIEEPCGGTWTGPGKIVDGVLFLDDETIQAAYVYLSTGEDRWGRAPGTDQTAVPRGNRGGFDLNGHLPYLGDGTLDVEVWGWGLEGLQLVGNLEFQPAPGVDTSDALGGGRVTLWWIENANGRSEDNLDISEGLVTSGLVTDHATTLSFRWASGIKPVTHVVWQVFPDAPPSDPSKIAPAGVLVQGTSENETPGVPGAVFTVDLAALMAPWYQTAEVYTPSAAEVTTGTTSPHSPVLQNLNITTHDEAAEAAGGVAGPANYLLWGGSSANQVPSLDIPLSPDYDAIAQAAGGKSINVEGLGTIKVSPPKPTSLFVRAIAFSGDQYLGVASNYVNILLEEVLVIEDLTPQQGSYELEIEVEPLFAADLSKEYCVDIVGWDSEAILANYDDPAWQNAWARWAWYFEKMGQDSPICAGCFVFDGNQGFKIGHQECSWEDSCPTGLGPFCDFVDMAIAIYDWGVNAFNDVKGWVVDVVVAISGCKHVGGVFSSDKEGVAKVCDGIAAVAVNVALMYLGIPPSFPSSEELIATAKGDVEQWLVSMAEQYGVPCDELSTLDEFVDLKGYTCEEMANYIVEQSIEAIASSFTSQAQAGLNFPAGYVVAPSAAGRLSPATVEVTVRTTENSPAHLTMCPANLQLWTSWKPKIAPPFSPQPPGQAGFWANFKAPSAGPAGSLVYSLVPWGNYTGTPFQPVTFMLPQPDSARAGNEATVTVNLGVANEYTTAMLWSGRPHSAYISGFEWRASDINRAHLIGHTGASVHAWVSSSCAGFAGDDSIVLPHGFWSLWDQ